MAQNDQGVIHNRGVLQYGQREAIQRYFFGSTGSTGVVIGGKRRNGVAEEIKENNSTGTDPH